MLASNTSRRARGRGRVAAASALALLALSGSPARLAAQPCPVPPAYAHSASVQDADLRITLAVDRATYRVGEGVNLYLSFENTSAAAVVIPNPNAVSPLHSFLIVPDGCTSLDDLACMQGLLFYYPTVVFDFGTPITVPAGACVEYTQAWNGIRASGRPVAPGAYSVFGGIHGRSGTFVVPPGGVMLGIRIEDPGEVLSQPASWGRVKTVYR